MADDVLSRPPGHLKSKVWDHFGFRKNSKDVVTCKVCYTDIAHKTGNTTNLSNHLKRKHSLNVNAKVQSKNESTPIAPGQPRLTEVIRQAKLNTFQSTLISQGIGGYLAADMRPFSTVQNDGFKHMIHVLEPRYKLPSRTYFSNTVLPSIQKTVVSRVKRNLQEADTISITTDAWTSRATENYVAVTAHFIDKKWNIQNYTLETRKFSESHTAENLAASLLLTISEWNLTRNGRGPAIATDNASNIVKAVKEAGLQPHIGCFAHTINIATQRGLKVNQMERLLGRVRRVVSFFHKSTSATSCLTLMQKKLELPNHKLLNDVPTRWNSTYDMLERYLEQQAAVFATLIDMRRNAKDLVTLTDDDMRNIEDVITVLKPLKTVTTMMCSQKHPTVSLIHPLKEMLLKQLEASPTDSGLMSDVKQAISQDLKPRYCNKEVLTFLLHSSALDPRFKALPYIDENARHEVFYSIGQSTVDLNTATQSQVKVNTNTSEPVEELGEPSMPSLSRVDVKTTTESIADDEPAVKVKRRDSVLSDLFGDVFNTHAEPGKSLIERKDIEINMYKEDEVASLESDPLTWWRAREGQYPLLSKYAKQCLGTPATSVASERVFSTAGDIVTAQRASLSSENVDMLVFLSKNIIIPDDLTAVSQVKEFEL